MITGLVLVAFTWARSSFWFASQAVSAAASAPLTLGVLYFSALRGNRFAWRLLVGLLPLALAVVPLTLYNLRFLEQSFLTQHGIAIGACVQGVLCLWLLHLRSAGRMVAAARLDNLSTKDSLTGLSNGVRLVDRLDGMLRRGERYRHACALAYFEVTNAQQILHAHGQAQLDQALVLAAHAVNSAIGPLDQSARVGNARFAVAVEGPVDQERINRLCLAVLASSLRGYKQLHAQTPMHVRAVGLVLEPQPHAAARLEDIASSMAGVFLRDESKRIHLLNLANIGDEAPGVQPGAMPA